MGYRSQVIAGVPVKDKEKALAVIKDWDETTEVDGIFYMRGDSWKWNDSYSDVKAFEKFICEDQENRFMTAMGEDGAEHSTYGEPWEYDINIMRYIESPFKT